MDATVLDARICVAIEHGHPYRFKDVHYRMMQDSVGKVWQLIDLPLLWFKNRENVIFRCLECSVFQTLMQCKNVGIPVLVVLLHSIGMQLALAGFLVRKFQVLQGYDLFK